MAHSPAAELDTSSPQPRQQAAAQPSQQQKADMYSDGDTHVVNEDAASSASTAGKVSKAADGAAVIVPLERQDSTKYSIYEWHSKGQRAIILATVSLASVLVPMCDTVYLPALQPIQIEMRTTQELVAASVAVYMFTVGLSSLFWGPGSDRFGRRRVYLVSTGLFLATSLVCVFAPSIGVLVAFRALQGAAVAAYAATGSGVIADTYAPLERGTALGISTIPMLVGPILGPILGGGLSQAFGWRSTFIAVTVFAGAIILPMLVFGLPETHHYKKLRRLHKKDPEAASDVHEAETILHTAPVFKAPWYPLSILIERDVFLHALVCLLVFGSMFCSITELPIYLANAPYNLSPSMIGLCYIPGGVAGLVASPIGGMLSDRAAAAHPGRPLVRLVKNNLTVGIVMPASLLLYGWAIHYKLHLAVVLVSQFFIGCSTSVYLPAIFGYLTALKQQAAAAAAAGVHSMMFIASGVLILVAAGAAKSMGMGPFMSLLAGLNLLVAGAASVQIFRHREESRQMIRAASQKQLADSEAAGCDVEAGSGGGSSGDTVAGKV